MWWRSTFLLSSVDSGAASGGSRRHLQGAWGHSCGCTIIRSLRILAGNLLPVGLFADVLSYFNAAFLCGV